MEKTLATSKDRHGHERRAPTRRSAIGPELGLKNAGEADSGILIEMRLFTSARKKVCHQKKAHCCR